MTCPLGNNQSSEVWSLKIRHACKRLYDVRYLLVDIFISKFLYNIRQMKPRWHLLESSFSGNLLQCIVKLQCLTFLHAHTYLTHAYISTYSETLSL